MHNSAVGLTGILSRYVKLRIILLAAVGALPVGAQPADWQALANATYQVTFRYPAGWKTSPAYSDRIYFSGADGSLQVDAATGDDPMQVCQQSAAHRMLPYGSRPQIRAIKVDGQRACLVWPSQDQDSTMEKYALAVVQYPQPVVINGSRYRLMTMHAHKKYAREIIASIRFLRGSVEPQKDGRSPRQ